ncbi:MAG: hypothetical protein Alpg2KO_17840 [Alphaproteobacteria bacterium]
MSKSPIALLALSALFLLPITASAQGLYEDDNKQDEKVIFLENKICGNVYLRQSLQRNLALSGGNTRQIINCFREEGRKLTRSYTNLLTGLDNACPGADVTAWVTDARRMPNRGCGENYQQPDWGIVPFVRN